MGNKISNNFKGPFKIRSFLGNFFEEILVPGDGHCFYHAVLFDLNSGETVRGMRHRIAGYLSNEPWWHQFVPCIKGKSSKRLKNDHVDNQNPIETYINGVRNEEWADDIEIEALSRLLRRPILIIGLDGKIYKKPRLDFLNNDPIVVLYNGENHYNALAFVSKKYTKQFVMYDLLDRSGYFKSEGVDVSSESFNFVFENELKKLYNNSKNASVPESELVERARVSAIIDQVNKVNKVNKLLNFKFVFENELREIYNNPNNASVPKSELVKRARVSAEDVLLSKELQELYNDPNNESLSDDILLRKAKKSINDLMRELHIDTVKSSVNSTGVKRSCFFKDSKIKKIAVNVQFDDQENRQENRQDSWLMGR